MARGLALALTCSCLVGVMGGPVSAETVALFDGRVRLAGEASGSWATSEDYGYFNYGSYVSNSLRLLRLDLTAELRLARVASVLVDGRSDDFGRPRLYALYLRLSPWPSRPLDLQAGLVPPVFGAYPRRRYAADNPLPSVPLVYQYRTDLRFDAIPATTQQLVAMRGRGWLVGYDAGGAAQPGLPLVEGERWDTGLQLRAGREPLSLAVALTQGSPSRPTFEDDNGGKQVSARLAWIPGPSLTVGLSAASGAYLARSVTRSLPASERGQDRQDALGLDLDWSQGYWIVRGELVVCRFEMPALDASRSDEMPTAGTPIQGALWAYGAYLEARYKIRPGFYAAGRLERLGFGTIDGAAAQETWDAPVTRVEGGLGFVPERHLLLKASWQHNWRDAGRVRQNDLVSGQLVLWF